MMMKTYADIGTRSGHLLITVVAKNTNEDKIMHYFVI